MPAMPMAVPRFSTGNTSMGTTDTNGSSTPDAAACSTRPQISRKNVGSCAKRRSRGKRPRCGEEQLTGGEIGPIKKAETGTMMPLTRGVYGHHPLRRGGIDGEVGHDDGQGGGHDGLIEQRQEGAEDHNTRDAHTVCCGGACIVQKEESVQLAVYETCSISAVCAHASYEHGGEAAGTEGGQRAWRAQH